MTLKHFIERPVLASVISIVIVIGGLIGLATLPVEQYPDIAPPTVMVRASYPGASAETIQKSVIVPLEQAINGVEDMTYMTSSAALGSASVTVYFRQGTDPDMAAVNVQNKVSRATGQLPSEVTQIGVTTMKRQTSMVKIFSLYSPDDTYDETFLSNYSKINIEPRILRIAGVGEAFTLGADYSMRIWLKPDVMAQYKLIPSDVTAALAEQNIESATGSLGENSENTFQYTMKYRRTSDDPGRVRGDRTRGSGRRHDPAPEGCRGHRAGKRILRLQRLHQRPSGRQHDGLPDRRFERHAGRK